MKNSDKAEKKICFVTPTLKAGGQERVISLLANFLIDKHFDVYIITLFKSYVAYPINPEVRIVHLMDEYISNFYNKITIVRLLTLQIRSIKPDLVISFGEVFNPISVIACKINRIPVIISDRSNPFQSIPFIRRTIKSICYPLASSLIAQTDRAKDLFMKRRYNNNIHVLSNPLKRVNNNTFNEKNKAIIHVGSLIDQKNQDDLIRVFKEINDKNWQVYLVGEGKRRRELTELINKFGLEEQIHLVGQVDDVDGWLKKGSIFVFPSLFEGFPNALNEAMAFPLACVAYDCPTGVRELIDNGVNGYIVPLGDRNLLRKRLKELMDNPDKRLQFMQQAINNREKYSLEKIGEEFVHIISNYM